MKFKIISQEAMMRRYHEADEFSLATPGREENLYLYDVKRRYCNYWVRIPGDRWLNYRRDISDPLDNNPHTGWKAIFNYLPRDAYGNPISTPEREAIEKLAGRKLK